MGWAKFRDKLLDVGAPIAGFAVGGPAGAAAAGAARQGYKKDESGKRWNLGNMAMGAATGYIGGQAATYGGIQGGQGFGKMFGSVGNFSPNAAYQGTKAWGQNGLAKLGGVGKMAGGAMGGGEGGFGGFGGGDGSGFGLGDALSAGIPAYLAYKQAGEGYDAQEGAITDANSRITETFNKNKEAYSPYEAVGQEALAGMRGFQSSSPGQYKLGNFAGQSQSPASPTWSANQNQSPASPTWSQPKAYNAPQAPQSKTYDSPGWESTTPEPGNPNLSGQELLDKDPGYNFRLSEGKRALEQSQAAKGGLFSGEAGKEMARYSQGLASQEYGAAADRQRQNTQDERDFFTNKRDFSRNTFSQDRNFGRSTFEDDRNNKQDAFRDERNYGRGAFENDRSFGRDAFENDRNFGQDRFDKDRNFSRGAFENDRGFNQDRFEGDRQFSRGSFEDDRNFGRGAFEKDRWFGENQDQARWGRLSDMTKLGTNARDRLADSRTDWGNATATNRLALGDALADRQTGRLGSIAGGFTDFMNSREKRRSW